MVERTQSPDSAWRERVEGKLTDIQIQVAKLSETQQTPAEVDAKLSTRVATETYASDQRGVNERLARIEASPMRALAWMGAIAGCLGTAIAAISVVLSIIFWLAVHH